MNTQITGQVFSSTAIINECKNLWARGEKQAVFSVLMDIANKSNLPQKPQWLYNLMVYYQYNIKDYVSALQVIELGLEYYPNNKKLLENKLILHFKLKQYDQAQQILQYLQSQQALDSNLLDLACHLFAHLKEFDRARDYGLKSLHMKDQESDEAFSAAKIRKKSAKAQLKQKTDATNYISFSLFGSDPKYLRGVFDNYLAAKLHFPDWKMVVFADKTVPQDVLTELAKLDVEVHMENHMDSQPDKLIWRFKPMDWVNSGRVLIRDVDSTLTKEEAMAVADWIKSDDLFHIIRDWYSHSELILAGLWGGVAGVLPKLEELKAEYQEGEYSLTHFDQHLLRRTVWPRIKQKAFVYDPLFNFYADERPHLQKEWGLKNHFGMVNMAVEGKQQAERIEAFKGIKSLML